MVVSAIYGLPLGFITSGVIVGLELSLIKAVALGFFFGLLLSLIGCALQGFEMQMKIVFAVVALIVIETLNGAIISLINS